MLAQPIQHVTLERPSGACEHEGAKSVLNASLHVAQQVWGHIVRPHAPDRAYLLACCAVITDHSSRVLRQGSFEPFDVIKGSCSQCLVEGLTTSGHACVSCCFSIFQWAHADCLEVNAAHALPAAGPPKELVSIAAAVPT